MDRPHPPQVASASKGVRPEEGVTPSWSGPWRMKRYNKNFITWWRLSDNNENCHIVVFVLMKGKYRKSTSYPSSVCPTKFCLDLVES